MDFKTMNELTILKLGGSVITKKDKNFTPNKEAIDRLSKEICKAKIFPIVIIHGGGSFGHPIARKYNINQGLKKNKQLLGFCKTHFSMVSLNKILLKSLLNLKIPVMSIASSSCIICVKGRIKEFNLDPIRHCIEKGISPIMYGDTVFDLEMGFSILSGDQLVSFLARKFFAKKIVIGVDVDGLFEFDPKIHPDSNLIEKINLEGLKKIKKNIVNSKRVIDVTGGMFGKISELILPVSDGIPCVIVNALKRDYIYRALLGESVYGTKIRKK